MTERLNWTELNCVSIDTRHKMKGCDYRKFFSIITPEKNQCLTLDKTDDLLTQFPHIQIDVCSTYLTYERFLNNSSVLIRILDWNMKYLLPENLFPVCVTRQFSSESICSFFFFFFFFRACIQIFTLCIKCFIRLYTCFASSLPASSNLDQHLAAATWQM